MSIVVVGGTTVDLIFHGLNRLPAWPDHTEFTSANLVMPGQAPLVTLGGNGANAAYVAAACGGQVTLQTSLGADALGSQASEWLQAVGCRVHLSARAADTAVNVTATDSRHRRATLFYPGAPVALPKLAGDSRRPHAVLVCGWPHPPLPLIARQFAVLRARGVLTAFDPGPLLSGPWTLKDLDPVLAHLDLLLVNHHELRVLARASGFATALKRFRARHAGDIVVKCGDRGALWLAAGKHAARSFPGRSVRAVNTVGAGDTFNGALLAALARGQAFPAAIRAANRLAAKVVASPRGVLGVRD